MFWKREEEIDIIKSSIEKVYWSNRWSNGEQMQKVSTLCKSHLLDDSERYECLPCNSGTSALTLACMYACVLNVKEPMILIPKMTAYAVPQAVTMSGAKIVYYDVTMKWGPDVDSIASILRLHKKNVVAIVVVHTGGIISESSLTVKTMIRAMPMILIEDFSHAQLSSINGYVAGSIGDISVCSMYATKSLNSGEGGIIAVNRNVVSFDNIYALWNAGRNKNEVQVTDRGFNARASEFQCAVMYERIYSYVNEIEERSNRALEYDKIINDSLVVPHRDFRELNSYSFYKYIVKADYWRIKEIKRLLPRESMTSAVHDFILDGDEDSVAYRLSKSHICLNMAYEDKNRVAQIINSL